MKIAISSAGKTIDEDIDARFGRCPYFLIVETENKKIKSTKVIENNASHQSTGAGITAGEIIGNENPDAIITTNMGPKAMQIFNQLKINIYQAQGNIKSAIENFMQGKLKQISESNGPMYAGFK